MLDKKFRVKSGIILFFFIVMLVFLAYRLFCIQFLRYNDLHKKAENIHDIQIQLEPKRGVICDRNGNLLAVSVQVPSLYADPLQIMNPKTAADRLAPLLELKKDFIYKRLSKKKHFVWLKRKITPELKKRIQSLEIKGLFFLSEIKRFYPKGKLAAHIIGFANIDNKGMDGIELMCNRWLAGKPGVRITEKDAAGREILGWRCKDIPPVEGYKVVLTIDDVIQYIVEDELDKALKQYNPKAGEVIVLDPYTGRILALANRPAYDLNRYNKADVSSMRNRIVADCFEPGSVFKIFTAAASLDKGRFKLSDKIFCENGAYKIPGGILHDHRPYGMLTFQQIIEKSSNIGIAKIGQNLGPKLLYKYLSAFGFGQKTGVSLPGEISGLLRPVSAWSGMSISHIPMGHEVSVTAIQLAYAAASIANGGILMKPLIIRRVVDNQGRMVKEFKPKIVRQIASKTAVNKLKIALKGVVSSHGTAPKAELRNFSVAGKTGTAQKLNTDGTYSHKYYMSSFVGFIPVQKPRILILVTFDSPMPLYYGGTVAAPVFKNIANRVLSYLNVEPDIKR